MWRRALGPLACLVLVASLALLFRAFTPRLAFNDGLGYRDGYSYAELVRAMREHVDVIVQAPYVYRLAPSAIVALTGLEVKRAFLWLNVASLVASALLLYALLRRYGATLPLALLGVLWWAALPAGLRFAYYYPVLLDGIGFLLLMLLIHASLARRTLLFALVLPLAVLTRENLVALVPFFWLAGRDARARRIGPAGQGPSPGPHLVSALASLPGVAAFVLVRAFPPIPPEKGFNTIEDMGQNLYWLATNDHERLWRFLAAAPLSLGLLSLVPFLAPRASLDFLRRHAAWTYYLGATLALTIVGGGDYDRFFFVLSPLLLVLAFPVARGAGAWSGRAVPVVLTALHLVAVRFLWPTAPDEESYRAYSVATMELQRLTTLLALAVPLFGGAFLSIRFLPRRV